MSGCRQGHPWAGPWKRGMRPLPGHVGTTEWVRSCRGGCHLMRMLNPIDPDDHRRSELRPHHTCDVSPALGSSAWVCGDPCPGFPCAPPP